MSFLTSWLGLHIMGIDQSMARQNADLVRANLTLEARVAERTLALEHANEQLRAFARTDGLLGINNRGYFDERLLEEVARAGTEHAAQRILGAVHALALPHERSEAARVVTLSVGGVSIVPGATDEQSSGATLIALADAALYVAKQQGRNRLVMGGP